MKWPARIQFKCLSFKRDSAVQRRGNRFSSPGTSRAMKEYMCMKCEKRAMIYHANAMAKAVDTDWLDRIKDAGF